MRPSIAYIRHEMEPGPDVRLTKRDRFFVVRAEDGEVAELEFSEIVRKATVVHEYGHVKILQLEIMAFTQREVEMPVNTETVKLA